MPDAPKRGRGRPPRTDGAKRINYILSAEAVATLEAVVAAFAEAGEYRSASSLVEQAVLRGLLRVVPKTIRARAESLLQQ